MKEEIIAAFQKSLGRFEEILTAEKTVANRDSAIKRFEFTVELAWKSAQKFLRDETIVCRSPKECLKEAFKFGLVEDDPRWTEMLEDRNLTSRTYDEALADAVYGRMPHYLELLAALSKTLTERLSRSS